MPLVEMPEGADEKRREKVAVSRGKLLGKAMEKYRFHFEPLCLPEGLIVEQGRASWVCASAARRSRTGRVVPTLPRPSSAAAAA